MTLRARLSLTILLLCFPHVGSLGASLVGTATVIDGDTVEVAGAKIRLFGIDAPELTQKCRLQAEIYRCGERAKSALAALLEGREVHCQGNAYDRYGRLLAVCSNGLTDVNGAMVLMGWAIAYRRFSGIYVGLEEQAKAARAGMWAGAFVEPEVWRREKLEVPVH